MQNAQPKFRWLSSVNRPLELWSFGVGAENRWNTWAQKETQSKEPAVLAVNFGYSLTITALFDTSQLYRRCKWTDSCFVMFCLVLESATSIGSVAALTQLTEICYGHKAAPGRVRWAPVLSSLGVSRLAGASALRCRDGRESGKPRTLCNWLWLKMIEMMAPKLGQIPDPGYHEGYEGRWGRINSMPHVWAISWLWLFAT